MIRTSVLLLLLLLLGGCAAVPTAGPGQLPADWQFNGRISLTRGAQG